jgi:hypothetical protein
MFYVHQRWDGLSARRTQSHRSLFAAMNHADEIAALVKSERNKGIFDANIQPDYVVVETDSGAEVKRVRIAIDPTLEPWCGWEPGRPWHGCGKCDRCREHAARTA